MKENHNIKEERLYLGDYEVYTKTVNGSLDTERTSLFATDGNKTTAQIDDAGTTRTVRYQYDNHLGSASLELDENAGIISYEEYRPFGTTSYRSGRSETEVSLKRYKYVGKERDDETGLYYYGARYYADWIGRFVSVDPLAGKFPFYTPYQYSGNNPATFYDLDGNEVTDNEVTKVKPNGQQGETPNFNISEYMQEYPIQADKTNLALPNEKILDLKLTEKSNPFNISGLQISEHNIPEIGPYNPTGLSDDFLKRNNKYWEYQNAYNEFIKTGQDLDPLLFGGNGFGLGLARDPFVQMAAQSLLLEGAVFPLIAKTGGALLWSTGKLLPETTKLGQVARSFEGIPSLKFTFGKETLKYTPFDEFRPFNNGIFYATDFYTTSSLEVYQKLSLGYKTSIGKINPISENYNIFNSTMQGFYLEGKIGPQAATLGGETQFVGYKFLTKIRDAQKIGRTFIGN